jgi:hypothetical protein
MTFIQFFTLIPPVSMQQIGKKLISFLIIFSIIFTGFARATEGDILVQFAGECRN